MNHTYMCFSENVYEFIGELLQSFIVNESSGKDSWKFGLAIACLARELFIKFGEPFTLDPDEKEMAVGIYEAEIWFLLELVSDYSKRKDIPCQSRAYANETLECLNEEKVHLWTRSNG